MQKIRNIYFKGKKRINAGFEDDLMDFWLRWQNKITLWCILSVPKM